MLELRNIPLDRAIEYKAQFWKHFWRAKIVGTWNMAPLNVKNLGSNGLQRKFWRAKMIGAQGIFFVAQGTSISCKKKGENNFRSSSPFLLLFDF